MSTWQLCTQAANHPAPTPASAAQALPRQVAQTTSTLMAMPFDMAREQYAVAVRAGLIQRSLLASSRFGRMLNALEQLTLGPWARSR